MAKDLNFSNMSNMTNIDYVCMIILIIFTGFFISVQLNFPDMNFKYFNFEKKYN
jgi:hypothetical protein